ncbi:hypothetical protein [Namhaeicola litoreus]|uniref:Uncharacterized protein n=1 Tax=Namhaeicola litoreus TaxID=1052145 RepID=A0ABW3Y2T4_9FLAO
MSDLEQINKILWHEFGHYMVDILLCKEYPKIEIEYITVRNFECLNNWCGTIKLIPDALLGFDKIIQEHKFFSYHSISLFSGCVFQAFHDKNTELEDCFSNKNKGSGKGDCTNFNELIFQIKRINNSSSPNNFNTEMFTIINNYNEHFHYLNNFHKDLNKVIDPLSMTILVDYKAKKEPTNFEYNIKYTDLDQLTHKVLQLPYFQSFEQMVQNTVQMILENIKQNI